MLGDVDDSLESRIVYALNHDTKQMLKRQRLLNQYSRSLVAECGATLILGGHLSGQKLGDLSVDLIRS